MMILNFNDLYHSGITPRVHGNGFIQLDIPSRSAFRLHVWPHPQLQAQAVYTGIHNHKFSFKSEILLGTLIHTQFENLVQDDNGEWKIYKPVPRDREDKGLELASPHLFTLTNPQKFEMSKGSEYEFPYGKFHDSKGKGLTATLIEKTEVNNDTDVIVACPKDTQPDNEFNRYQFDQDVLWSTIEEVFFKINCLIV